MLGKLARKSPEAREFKAIRAYLIEDGMINHIDMANYRERSLSVGMSQCGVFAALGQPSRINNTTNASGSSAQFVYENGRYPYVYTTEHKRYRTQAVTSFRH